MKRSTRDRLRKILKSVSLLAVLVAIGVIAFLGIKNYEASNVKLVSKWENCRPTGCTFNLKVENTSHYPSSGFAQIDLFKRVGRVKTGTYSLAKTEKFYFELSGMETREIQKHIKTDFLVVHYEVYIGEKRESI